jgi:DNA-binding response OmpR family regulator
MLSNIRVLVVEAEFLVALDIQRVLQAADAAETALARTIEEAAGLAPRFTCFHLAILESPPGSIAAMRLAESLASAGVAVVLVTTDPASASSNAEGSPFTILAKPFAEAELLAACAKALALGNRGSVVS